MRLQTRLRRSFLLDFTILFAVGGLVLSLATGFAVSRVIGVDIKSATIEDVGQFTKQVTAAQITNQLRPDQLDAPLRGSELASFDRFVHDNMLVRPILRVNVWNAAGMVIYSSDQPTAGQTFPLDEHLREAMAGQTQAGVEDADEAAEGTPIEGVDQVVEVYTPIVFDSSSPPVGAFEIYRDYGPVADHIARLQRTVYIGLAAALGALYLILVVLAKHGSDLIRRQQRDLQLRAEELNHLAFHDPLTDLPNVTLFKDRLNIALAQARRSGDMMAVAFLDLDKFKFVNDTLGHAMGDELLRTIAEELSHVVRESDTVARVGGDEFTLLLPVGRLDDAIEVANRVLNKIRQTRLLAGREFHSSASMGIAIYPSDGEDADTLLRNADTAMYKAKEDGRDSYKLFTSAMSARVMQRVALEHELRQALQGQQFVLHYQPQVNSSDCSIIGAEALIRWQHPERGLLAPADFMPVAEESGLIVEIGEFVLRTACTQAMEWRKAGHPAVPVAVNLSARQFEQKNLVELIRGVLTESGLEPGCLRLEITESAVMHDVDYTIPVLHELKNMGVSVSIDDFGTGYSSLDYLKRFPIDEVKIDRSFIRDIFVDEDDTAIVDAIIGLIRSLNLRVIAEGVETEEQMNYLSERQCHDIQGFLFGKPMSASEFEVILSQEHHQPVTAG